MFVKLTDCDLLRKLYVDDGLSENQIAERLGCAKRTVHLALVRFGIPRRTRYEGLKHYYDVYYEKITPELRAIRYSEEEEKLLALAIDLEGTIALTKGKTRRIRGYIAISNINLDILNYIHRLARVGKVCEPRELKKGNRRPVAIWWINGFMPMKLFLEQTKDYFIIKKSQAQLMIQFCESRIESPRAPYTPDETKIYEEMRMLNRRGRISHRPLQGEGGKKKAEE